MLSHILSAAIDPQSMAYILLREDNMVPFGLPSELAWLVPGQVLPRTFRNEFLDMRGYGMFLDREDAGRKLAERMTHHTRSERVVLG